MKELKKMKKYDVLSVNLSIYEKTKIKTLNIFMILKNFIN
jgi:hypothetical protein